jgi:cytidylate kinase
MPNHAIRLITVSREFGAGGSDLAAVLGARLGWPVLDRDLIHRVAERLRLDDSTVEHLDEHPPSLMARIASVLIIPQPDHVSFAAPTDLASADRIAEASRAAITEAGASPPIIVVGHGAQCIFAGREDALHVRVVAPVNARLERVSQRLGVDAGNAAVLLRRADDDRRTYVQRYFHQDLRNELLYDMLINTGRVSIDEAATAIAEVVRNREGSRASPVEQTANAS